MIISDKGIRESFAMSAASYLHIRSGDDSPERVLPLQGTRAQIGRGSQCEIQLDDPTLAEVALVLRRRGSVWHAHAAEPGGLLSIDGVEALGQRRIAQGSALEIGNYRLTLRYVEVAEPAEPEEAESQESNESVEAATSLDHRTERLEQWQASLERRERWLLARKERLKWEKRWRDAGERHRNRPVPTAPGGSNAGYESENASSADRSGEASDPSDPDTERHRLRPRDGFAEPQGPAMSRNRPGESLRVEVQVEAPEPVCQEAPQNSALSRESNESSRIPLLRSKKTLRRPTE